MKSLITKVVLSIVSMSLMAGCTSAQYNQARTTDSTDLVATDTISVVSTVFPLYDIASEIGGDAVSSTLLLPPGASPHSYEPTPSDIMTIADADIFIYIGGDMEPWAEDILSGIDTKNLVVIQASSFVNLISEHEHDHDADVQEEDMHNGDEQNKHEDDNTESVSHDEFDPHVWLDIQNDILIAKEIADELAVVEPEKADLFNENLGSYQSKLEELDQLYTETLSSCNQDTMITAGHNAYGYLAHRYNFGILSAYGFSPDSEPTPRQIANMIDLVEQTGVHYIASEDLIDSRVADTLAAEAGVQTIPLAPAGNITLAQYETGVTFLELMEENLNALTLILECNE